MLWYDAIYPYTRNNQLLYCPNRKDLGPGYGLNPLCTHLSMSRVWDAASCIVVGDVLPEGIGARAGWPATGDPARWWINDPGNDLCRAAVDPSYSGLGVPSRTMTECCTVSSTGM